MKEVSKDQLAEFVKGGARNAERATKVQPFVYRRPDLENGRQRAVCILGRTDIILGAVQLFKSGGEHVRHAHPNMDGFWFVLKGRVRFHFDDGDTELGAMEGLIVPRGRYYWFETVGDEPLEILQVDSIHPQLAHRLDFAPEDEPAMMAEINSAALFSAERED